VKRYSKIKDQLTLKRETIRKLLDQELQVVVGGSETGANDPDIQRVKVKSVGPICH
jgi:hypothetical protein